MTDYFGLDPFEAVVVGAGPGGSAAAYQLASCGRRVLLLDRRTFPRDKCCGDGLTRSAVHILTEMGVLATLDGAQCVDGVRVHMRHRGSRVFRYEGVDEPGYGMVVPRLDLDARLCAQAVQAGATLWTGARATRLLGSAVAVQGVEVVRNGQRIPVRAPVVVAADGASSQLARQAGLRSADREWTGFAARGYFTDIDDLDDLLEIHLPLVDVSERHLLPSYGWVFPTGPGLANVGVGLFEPSHGTSIRSLYERFVQQLADTDPRFRRARPSGSMTGAPLRMDFDPARCGAPGLLLVGDAAGLVSPFTGEGISLALESGILAATQIDAALTRSINDPVDPTPYARQLAARHGGYFETGQYSVRRYLLAWRVLESTFHDDRPLFTLCRQLALFPDGSRADVLLDPLPLPQITPNLTRLLRRDLLGVAELLAGCLRDDWPMFVRLAGAHEDLSTLGVRPAVLLLTASYVGGRSHPLSQALAAAMDLGLLAGLAMDSTQQETRQPSENGHRPVPWGNRFAVLAADFLLARSYEFATHGGGPVVAEFARALTSACEGRARELRVSLDGVELAEHVDMLSSKMAMAFELPCRIGGRLGGASTPMVNALATYGRHLGVSCALAEELRDVTGARRWRYATRPGNPREAANPDRPDDSQIEELSRLVADYAHRAREALERVPDGPARDLLALLTHRPLEPGSPRGHSWGT